MKVGILGAGQLGRMLALAAHPLALACRVLDPAEDAPAGAVAEHFRGGWRDEALLERFRHGLDVATYEFENVPVEAARSLERHLPVLPTPAALEVAQDRLTEKTFFRERGIPTAEFGAVDSLEELRSAATRIGLPAVLKTRREGYDGKGQVVVQADAELEAAWRALAGRPLILEAFVDFVRELSVLAVRGRDGEVRCWPIVENVHEGGILRTSRAPAPGVDAALQSTAEDYSRAVMEELGYVGVLAIELFDTGRALLANEMAPRVHNSGHWTIEGAVTSQFENHLRAVCGLPLGSTAARGLAAMINLVGVAPDVAALLRIDGAHVHLYGKAPRPGRKLGHVTVVHEDIELVERAVGLIAGVLPTITPLAPSNRLDR